MLMVLPPPTKKELLQDALARNYALGLNVLYRHAIVWAKVHFYLLGYRQYNGLWTTGMEGQRDRSDQRVVRWERALSAIQTDIGRIMALDMRPKVTTPEGLTLTGLQDAALAQAGLNYLTRFWNMDHVKMALAYYVSAFGTGGLSVSSPLLPSVADTARIETLAPWELMPLPGQPVAWDAAQGRCRRRWVELDWLREVLRPQVSKFPSAADLDATDAPPATLLRLQGEPALRETEAGRLYDTDKGGKTVTQRGGRYVLLKEWWEDGPLPYSCGRWIVEVGQKTPHILLDNWYAEDFADPTQLPVCPTWPARYLSLGGWYGRGLADRLIFLNQDIEEVLGNFVQNLSDLDLMGMILYTPDMGLNLRTLKGQRKNRFGTYNPDPTADSLQPMQIAPANLGAAGMQAIQFLAGLVGPLANQGELYAGRVPGGLESARALGVYLDSQNVPFSPITESLASAFVGCYTALHSIAKTMLPSRFPLKTFRMDEAPLGIRINAETGDIEPAIDKYPNTYAVDITVRAKAPESPHQQLATLREELQMGTISPLLYSIVAQREGLLGSIVPDRGAFESYKKAVWETRILFGDGETPGQLGTSYMTNGSIAGDNHRIHKMVHGATAASLAFARASDAVRSAILEHMEAHDLYGSLPENRAALDTLAGMQGAGGPGALPVGLPGAGAGPSPLGQETSMGAPPYNLAGIDGTILDRDAFRSTTWTPPN